MKSPEMEKTLENLGQQMFNRSRDRCARDRTCLVCGGEAKEFKDPLSLREYAISRMCQSCQDAAFDGGDDY